MKHGERRTTADGSDWWCEVCGNYHSDCLVSCPNNTVLGGAGMNELDKVLDNELKFNNIFDKLQRKQIIASVKFAIKSAGYVKLASNQDLPEYQQVWDEFIEHGWVYLSNYEQLLIKGALNRLTTPQDIGNGEETVWVKIRRKAIFKEE